MSHHDGGDFLPLSLAIATVSDSRVADTDTSGQLLRERALAAGHHVLEHVICRDDLYQLRALLSRWIADAAIQVILTTGGTGLTGRDRTPEAVLPLLDKPIDGFGELFRALSRAEIGTATVQSRACAGLANGTLIFCLPGSTGACRTAWDGILAAQLDRRTRPCNFVQLLHRFVEDRGPEAHDR